MSASTPLKKITQKTPIFRGSRMTVLIGNSFAGKTTIVRQIIYDAMKGPHPRYKKILLLCPTHDMGSDYDMLPEEWKFKQFDLKGFYERLKEVQYRKRDPNTKAVPDSDRVLLILDDCITDISGTDPTLKDIASKARHYKIDVIIVSQHMSGLTSPLVRSNTTTTLFGRMQDVNRETVTKTIASMGTKKDAVDYVNKTFSDPYRFIVLSNHPDDEMPLYTYKVNTKKLPDKFKIRLKPKQVNEDMEQLQEPSKSE